MPLCSRVMRLLAVACLSILSACASQRAREFDHALAETSPPPDFWLAITVLRAPAETAGRAAAYQKLPVGIRPARYIIEADGILRAATGSGANVNTFPDQTRQLDDAQIASLWTTLRDSSLVRADHPSRGVEAAVSAIGDKTVYVVSFAAGGTRRVLTMEAAPKPGEGAEEVRQLVERVAGLAWVK